VAEEARGDELLVSDRALSELDAVDARKKRRFSVKGVPKDLTVYSVSPTP
jgi:hypothetical protein